MSLDRHRRAVVTGASRGIGAAIVRRLRRAGLEVHAVARSAAPLAALATETGCRPLVLDIADRAATVAALAPLEADILVNNASALVHAAPAWQADPADVQALLDVNLVGLLNGLAATVPGMVARGRGHIVNLGSMAGGWTVPGMPVYAMTKAAIRSLGNTLRLDLHGSGVRVSEIAPGRVETGAHLAMADDPEEGRRRFYDGLASLQPDDVAASVEFVLAAPQRMDVSYMEIVPTDQSYGGSQFHRRGG